jgi:hypothetical protein
VKNHKYFQLLSLAVLLTFLRTYLDISATYTGLEGKATFTVGFLELVALNLAAALVIFFLIKYFVLKTFTLATKDFLVATLCVIFLPAFLSFDIKVSQILPGVPDLGIEEEKALSLQSVYDQIAEPVTRDINYAVRKKVKENVAEMVRDYGCPAGMSELEYAFTTEIHFAGNLTDSEKTSLEQEIHATITDETLTEQQRAENVARRAIKAFGLKLADAILSTDYCIKPRLVEQYSCAVGVEDLKNMVNDEITQSALLSAARKESAVGDIEQINSSSHTAYGLKAERIINIAYSTLGEVATNKVLKDPKPCLTTPKPASTPTPVPTSLPAN